MKQGKTRSWQIEYPAEYVSRGGLRGSKERGSGDGQTEGRVTKCMAGSIEPHRVQSKFTIIPIGKTGGVKATEQNQEPTFTESMFNTATGASRVKYPMRYTFS